MKVVVESIQVGRPRTYNKEDGECWISAIEKRPIKGAVEVRTNNIVGDEQSDHVHHGGIEKAVLAYSSDHFGFWRRRLADKQIGCGAFGENLTVAGVTESDVCIGDVFRVGTCRLQISQPRQPCWKLSRYWHEPSLAVEVQKSGRTGWYFRVLTEGVITPGDSFDLIERTYPDFSVAWANGVMHAKPRQRANDLSLAECTLLSVSWREQLQQRAMKGDIGPSSATRLEIDE